MDMWQKAQRVKESRNSYYSEAVTEQPVMEQTVFYDVTKITAKTCLCADCLKPFTYRSDTRYKNSQAWSCECGMKIRMSPDSFLKQITELLNNTIQDAENIKNDCDTELSLDTIRTENETARAIEMGTAGKEELINMILECAAKKYNDLSLSARHITDRLKADFANASPLSAFNRELFVNTVSNILLSKTDMKIKLKNGIIIGKEKANDTDSHVA